MPVAAIATATATATTVCRTLESLEGCFAKCYHVSLGLGKWRGVLAQMSVCGPQALLADLACCSFPGAAGAGALDSWIIDV